MQRSYWFKGRSSVMKEKGLVGRLEGFLTYSNPMLIGRFGSVVRMKGDVCC